MMYSEYYGNVVRSSTISKVFSSFVKKRKTVQPVKDSGRGVSKLLCVWACLTGVTVIFGLPLSPLLNLETQQD